MGKFASRYEKFKIRARLWNELNSYVEVPLYIKNFIIIFFFRNLWLGRLLRRINFGEVSWWELDSLLENQEPLAARLVYAEAVRQNRPSCGGRLLSGSPLVNSRGMELAIVKVNIISYSSSTTWTKIPFDFSTSWSLLDAVRKTRNKGESVNGLHQGLPRCQYFNWSYNRDHQWYFLVWFYIHHQFIHSYIFK